MLDTLDVLIGFTVVMLVVSMAVTMITQAFSTAVVNLRGMCLHAGMSKLLALMDRGLTAPEARRLADHILRNPLVGTAPMLWSKRHGLTSVIHREELVKLILDFAVPGDAEKANDVEAADEESLRNKVRRSLALNGIPDPAAVLESVRRAVVELEKTNPELSHNARLNIALLNFASSDYLSKLNAWFDQTIDRVSELFTRRIRAVTVAVAVVLAFLIQLDSVGLINRLSVDDATRDRLVSRALAESGEWGTQVEAGTASLDRIAQGQGQGEAQAPAVAGDGEPAQPPPADPDLSATQPGGAGEEDGTAQQIEKARRTIEQLGVVSLPAGSSQWKAAWWESNAKDAAFRWPFLLGILLSAALLSLGAPFWYSVLANLLKLRSVISRKDEVQRIERQTTQVATAAVVAPLPPGLAGGEAGDLRATG